MTTSTTSSSSSATCRYRQSNLAQLRSWRHHPRGDFATVAAKGKGGGSGNTTAASGLMSGIHPDSVEACARIVERAQAASDKWSLDYTDFLDPALADDAMTVVGRMADCEARAWGGYERAERVRLVLGRPEAMDAEEDGYAALTQESDGIVTLLDIQGNFLFDKADHRDFLGATLGAGIDRDRVGDILVHGERGAQILTTREMGNFLSSALTQVRSVPVTAIPTSLAELRVPPARVVRLMFTINDHHNTVLIL